MIDKRMMYAMGQRVSKNLDGSRPGYAGPAGGQSSGGNYGGGSGPAGGASAGGNYGGNSSGGTSPGGMSNTGGNRVDPGFQNALDKISTRQDTIKNQNNTNYGQFYGSRVPTYSPMSFGNKVGNVVGGIGDYIKGGGLIGMGIRGLAGLFGGPTTKDTTAPDQRNMFDVSGPVSGPPAQRGGEGEGIMAMYNPNMLNISGEVVDEVPVSREEEDFIQRFRVANKFRQDKQGQLDPAILEMISKLYT